PRDHDILFRFRQGSQHRAWLAALEEHGAQLNVGFKKPDSRISVPEAQAMDLMLALKMGHAGFHYGRRPVCPQHWRNPGTAHFRAVEWSTAAYRPSALEFSEGERQALEPHRPLWNPGAICCEARWDGQCHAFMIVRRCGFFEPRSPAKVPVRSEKSTCRKAHPLE